MAASNGQPGDGEARREEWRAGGSGVASFQRTLSVVGTAVSNAFRPTYLRHLARETDRWGWEHARRPVRSVTLESLEAESNGGKPFELRLFRAPFAYGDTGTPDMMALCTLVSLRKPKTVFEFGTFRGFMTVNLAPGTYEFRYSRGVAEWLGLLMAVAGVAGLVRFSSSRASAGGLGRTGTP